METVKFGKTGMRVSKICLGCMTYGSTKWRDWVLEEEASRPFIREALEKGINFFDTADVYSQGASEEILARAKGHAEFVSMQNYYNLVYREEEREMMPLCAHDGIAVIPWSPMARGYLAGSGMGGEAKTLRARSDPFGQSLGFGTKQDEAIRARLNDVAEKHGVKPAVVALAWVLSKPFITAPIIGASKPHHIDDAVAALAFKLDAKTIAKLEEPYRPKAVAGHA